MSASRSSPGRGSGWYQERLHTHFTKKGYAQRFEVVRTIVAKRTPFQELVIFQTRHFGRVLALDGIIQTTEADEFVYHEMMTHIPMFAHGRVRDLLIIGAGDGGILRESLRHKSVRSAVMVEIDGDVVRECARHMPGLNGGAFKDPRAEVIIGDGIDYVRKSTRKFDAILVDSTDPIGPGEVLFTDDFYRNCRRILNKGGLVVTQNGVPFFQPEEVITTRRRLGAIFKDVTFYYLVVPTYIGGMMTLAWATDAPGLRRVSLGVLERRFKAAGFKTRYYTPGIHIGAFELPPFIGYLAAPKSSPREK
ncbi:MAG: polyamine aminopropyltransferase [Pseudomonadota bacterium]